MTLRATKRLLLPLSLVLLGSCLIVGCSEEEDEETQTEPAPECQAIGDACTHDVSGELADECHDVYHHNDADECAERKDECVDFCTSHRGEGGGAGAGH